MILEWFFCSTKICKFANYTHFYTIINKMFITYTIGLLNSIIHYENTILNNFNVNLCKKLLLYTIILSLEFTQLNY